MALSYFIWFLAFSASANIASKALKECGFSNLGFYSLAISYLFFGIQSFLSPFIIRKIKLKYCLIGSAAGYGIWILSLAITSISLKNETISKSLSYTTIYIIVMICGAFLGVAASIGWVAQGKYLSECTLSCLDKKGLYSSIFWTLFFLGGFISSILNAYILGYYPQEYLFVICLALTIIAIVMLYYLPEIKGNEQILE